MQPNLVKHLMERHFGIWLTHELMMREKLEYTALYLHKNFELILQFDGTEQINEVEYDDRNLNINEI